MEENSELHPESNVENHTKPSESGSLSGETDDTESFATPDDSGSEGQSGGASGDEAGDFDDVGLSGGESEGSASEELGSSDPVVDARERGVAQIRAFLDSAGLFKFADRFLEDYTDLNQLDAATADDSYLTEVGLNAVQIKRLRDALSVRRGDLPPASLVASAADTDEDTDDEDAMKKLENEINSEILLQYHPELKQNNASEISALSVVVKDKHGAVIDPLHRTVPFLTKYERARILGLRTKQLNYGAQPFVDVSPEMIKGYTIAVEELKQKRVPFIIRRPLPNGASEYWKVSDLEIIDY